MAKTPAKLTEEELKSMIQLETGSQAAKIAEGVFEKLFEDVQSKMDGKVSKLVYGGIIATVLVLISLCFSTWLFMASYQADYLDAQNSFSEQINSLRTENVDLKSALESDMEDIGERQDYLEKLLLESAAKR